MQEQDFYFEAKALTVGYDKKEILSDVSFAVKKGEILSLIGPNGAGKTTMLKSMIKQLAPLAGVAVLKGKELGNISADDLAKQMGVVLTQKVSAELMSVEELVESGRYPYTGRLGILGETDHAIVQEVMKRIGIWEWRDLEFVKLSDGQKQRVMLARALAGEPEIIVLDEPTSYLDIRYKLEFLTLLKKLAREQRLTVIMSIHEVELAKLISDRIACFREGRLDRIGTVQEVITEHYLEELFGIETDLLAPEFIKYINMM